MPINQFIDGGIRGEYQRKMLEIRSSFELGATGRETLAARSAVTDDLVRALWREAVEQDARLGKHIALVAVGGYGRRELFPFSDIDLLFLLDSKVAEKDFKDPIRRMSQELWDCGLRVSATTRKLNECERFDPQNVEFTLALLDHRLIQEEVGREDAGREDAGLFERMSTEVLPKLLEREHAAIGRRLTELTVARHAKYGSTLFHLEPNIKDCPGGLRDVHVCGWLTRLKSGRWGIEEAHLSEARPGVGAVVDGIDVGGTEFAQAVEFLQLVRCFLHYRHERDDNTLDWQAQDAAAAAAIGLRRSVVEGQSGEPPDPAYWMRYYFRHARIVDRSTAQFLEQAEAGDHEARAPLSRLARLAGGKGRKRNEAPSGVGFRVEH
jgi:[protein-PII] uridylyltransferase